MNTDLLLGIGKSIITPKVGCNLAGYRPDVISTSVNDDLTATAFYFKQGDTDALLVSITLCSISTPVTNRLFSIIESECGIEKSRCILHTTHTHSGPNLMGSYGWGVLDIEYLESILIPNLTSAIKEAKSNTRAVKMAVKTGESLVGINRRKLTLENQVVLGQNPWGVFDPKMTVIAFEDFEGNNVANIVHYAAHGTAAGTNTEISRDWSGVMTDVLEEESGAVTAYLNGAEGDVGPRLTNGKTKSFGDIKVAMRHGAWAAQDAVRIYKQKASFTTPKLDVFCGKISIPLDKRIPLEAAKEEYKKYVGHTINLHAKLERYYSMIIKSYEEGYKDLPYYEIEQPMIKLGDLVIIATPYELFSEIALRIAYGSKLPHVLMLSNTNGREGYFATESELCRGGYEIDSFISNRIQPPVKNADWHFVTQTLENIKKVGK